MKKKYKMRTKRYYLFRKQIFEQKTKNNTLLIKEIEEKYLALNNIIIDSNEKINKLSLTSKYKIFGY